eukprot:673180-Rhodomonas_salina.2
MSSTDTVYDARLPRTAGLQVLQSRRENYGQDHEGVVNRPPIGQCFQCAMPKTDTNCQVPLLRVFLAHFPGQRLRPLRPFEHGKALVSILPRNRFGMSISHHDVLRV